MAKQENRQIRLLAVLGIIAVMEDDPVIILDSSGVGVVIDFVLGCCEDNHVDSYNLRLESLEFWPIYLRNEKGINILRQFLPRLLSCLLTNSIFTDFDYIEMDPSHFEDKVEDDLHSVGPRFHQSRVDHGDSGDEVEIGAWGNQWTVRKASALALDHISMVYGDEILGELLPKIEATLQNPNWERQESAILALGAIARGCIKGLSPFLPRVLTYMVKLTSNSRPLIRSISCWCISRFTPWLALQQGQPILGDAFGALLTRMLDPNKRVEEAACSATATFIEDSARSMSLDPFIEDVICTLSKALTVYQYRNLLILCDTITTLCFSVGPKVFTPTFESDLAPLLITKWKSFSIEHPCLVASMDAIAKIFSVVGLQASKFTDPILEHCVRGVLLAALNHFKSSEEVPYSIQDAAECALDLVSSVVETIKDPAVSTLERSGFPSFLLLFCQEDRFPNVKQSAFACVGDIAKFGNDSLRVLKPSLPNILQLLAIGLSSPNIGVSNNAAWAIGEIATHGNDPEVLSVLEPLSEHLIGTLVGIIVGSGDSSPSLVDNLAINSCIALGRIAVIFPSKVGGKLGACANRSFLILAGVRNDQEKVNAVRGILLAIQSNPALLTAPSLGSLFGLLNSLQSALDSKSNFSEFIVPVIQSAIKSIYLGSTNKEVFLQIVQSQNSYIQALVSSSLGS
ncbi:HEAT repeat-containing protein [Cryptosporidium felis]|nr:HEAT repeat-containing protein [Cryptosporidium felis]